MSQESARIFLDKMQQKFGPVIDRNMADYAGAAETYADAMRNAAMQGGENAKRFAKDAEAYGRAWLNHTSSPEQLRMNTAIGAGIGGLAGAGLGYLAGDGAGALIGGLGGTALGGYSGYNINNIRAALGLL